MLTLASRVKACLTVRGEGIRVRFSEPQMVQGCKKIEPVGYQVNSCYSDVLREGLQIRKKRRELGVNGPVYAVKMTEK
ncbi:hypothetical protein [Lelliottia sp. CFBP8978]|uniref:hypothetical protein n=1 Tax=Lelliottia sp. CFBP8978 TaxID=3096522 RepID=UPI002A6A4E04|nr:hypothetical protein [Lelliottia sp. CFBP8978]